MRGRGFLLAPAAAAAVWLAFAGDGLLAYFTPDDMMNLYGAWQQPFATGRLAGTLFYAAGFHLFGMNPLGYRIACFVLMAVNLALLYGFALRLARSRGVAALAVLAGAYHAHLADLYYSTGAVYDLLCAVFWLGAFVRYAGMRERGVRPGWGSVAALGALYAVALFSKEMAASLPAFLVLYETLYRGGKESGRDWRFPIAASALTLAWAAWKVFGPERMSANPEYAIHLSFAVWAERWGHYLYDLFYGAVRLTSFAVAALWTALLALAAASRRRDLLFAWCLMFFGPLPVLFISERGLYALYPTIPGWCLYIAGAIDLLLPRRHAIAFVALAVLLVPLHAREKPKGKAWVAGAFESIRGLRNELTAKYPAIPKGARVLFLSDPYPEDDWIVTFIFRLHYRDPEIQVDRIRQTGVKPGPPESYRHVFRYEGGRLMAVAASGSR